uniref:G-protein coupled receptors family 1 profile domain-containing protein n=1 Tax=Romanomermis culicivorax TaxID=13658 RepID=A0A915I7H5_ROMCU
MMPVYENRTLALQYGRDILTLQYPAYVSWIILSILNILAGGKLMINDWSSMHKNLKIYLKAAVFCDFSCTVTFLVQASYYCLIFLDQGRAFWTPNPIECFKSLCIQGFFMEACTKLLFVACFDRFLYHFAPNCYAYMSTIYAYSIIVKVGLTEILSLLIGYHFKPDYLTGVFLPICTWELSWAFDAEKIVRIREWVMFLTRICPLVFLLPSLFYILRRRKEDKERDDEEKETKNDHLETKEIGLLICMIFWKFAMFASRRAITRFSEHFSGRESVMDAFGEPLNMNFCIICYFLINFWPSYEIK